MRTTTTKSFTIALVLTTVLTAPLFAARDDAKRERGNGDKQQTPVQRVIDKIVHIFDSIILPHPEVPTDPPTTTT